MRGNLIGFFILHKHGGMYSRIGIGVLALLPCVLVVVRLTSEGLRMFWDVWLNIENDIGLHIIG